MPPTSQRTVGSPSPSSKPVTGDVIGCVYLYPSESPDSDVTVQSWVRASHDELDVPLADAVTAWLAAEVAVAAPTPPRPLSRRPGLS